MKISAICEICVPDARRKKRCFITLAVPDDIGSGAGNDCFIARHETGETGKVIGVDFTPAMIDKARANAEIRGFNNVEFRQGDIEHMPITANTADVVVSNCVLKTFSVLSPSK